MVNEDSKDTKEIILTGEAAQSMNGGRAKRRSRKNQNGGGSTQGAIVQLQSTSSANINSTAEVTGVNPSKLVATAEPVISDMKGGKVKVILKEAKKKNQKVILSVGKISNLKPLSASKNKTRSKGASKQIKFSLKNLSKKLHTAKTIKKHSQEKSIHEIKKILEESKLIKKDSKAPEAMIRQIYNDYMAMKHKAL